MLVTRKRGVDLGVFDRLSSSSSSSGEVSIAGPDEILAAPRADLQHPAAEHAPAYPEGGASALQAHERRAVPSGGSLVSVPGLLGWIAVPFFFRRPPQDP